MVDRVVVRSMRAGEEEPVCALVARVFHRFVAPDFPPEGIKEFLDYARPEAMAERRKAGERVLVAEDQDGLVGMLELRGLDHIAMLFVEAQGRGVGRMLVEEALRICQEQASAVRKVTVHASRYAVPIYHKLGFAPQGPERTEHGITYVPMAFEFESGAQRDG